MTVVVFCLDYEKAFDKIHNSRLLQKLELVGIRGIFLIKNEAILRHRTFLVRAGETLSEEQDILSGVPQGSILGPLLYFTYTFESSCSLHAVAFSLMMLKYSQAYLKPTDLDRGLVHGPHEQLAVLVSVVVVGAAGARRLLAQHLHQLLRVPRAHQLQR